MPEPNTNVQVANAASTNVKASSGPKTAAAIGCTLLAIVIGFGILVEFVFWDPQKQSETLLPLEVNWLLSIVATVLFISGLGFHISGQWISLLIDNRNKISLSRWQIVLRTALLTPAIVVALLQNARVSDPPILVFFTGAVQASGPSAAWLHHWLLRRTVGSG